MRALAWEGADIIASCREVRRIINQSAIIIEQSRRQSQAGEVQGEHNIATKLWQTFKVTACVDTIGLVNSTKSDFKKIIGRFVGWKIELTSNV